MMNAFSAEDLPLVSIGLVARDAEATIRMAVASILAQTYCRWELLIADDGSVDRTSAIVQSFSDSRIHLYTFTDSRGLASRLNELIGISQGRYFARMDADDISYPSRLDRQVKFMQSNPGVDIVGSGTINFKGAAIVIGKSRVVSGHDRICEAPWRGFPLYHPTWFGKSEWFKLNQYDALIGRAQDFELLLRTFRHSKFDCIQIPLLGYRCENLTVTRQWRSRTNVAKLLWTHACRTRSLRFFAGVAQQALKMVLDVAAIESGLGYRLLRHRAKYVAADEKAEFAQAWETIVHVAEDYPSCAE